MTVLPHPHPPPAHVGGLGGGEGIDDDIFKNIRPMGEIIISDIQEDDQASSRVDGGCSSELLNLEIVSQ